MPTKDDQTRKVKALLAKADSTTPEEAASLRAKAQQIRLKYGVSDQDLIDAESLEELDALGFDLFRNLGRLTNHTKAIRAEIDRAKATIDRLPENDQASLYQKLRTDVKGMLETLDRQRDRAVRSLYQRMMEAELKQSYRSGSSADDPHLHEHVVTMVNINTDVRKDQIERIVGVSSKGLWLKLQRANVCTVCGLDGNQGREMCGLYGDRPDSEWMHASCAEGATT